MKQLIIIIFFPLSLWADTTGNLLNQNFTTWSGTNQSSRHSTGTIAGVDNKYVESTISLSDTLTESQINNGWTSTLGADIWHWNTLNSTTTMSQTITNADGTITTQIRNVANSSCGYNNCGAFATYTDSYTQGINSQSDYDIAVRFTFDESSNSSSHYATDLKNPTLTIEHSLISTEQAIVLSTISEDIIELVEEVPEFEEILIEEFEYTPIEETVSMTELFEEFFFEQTTEEINTGIIPIFEVTTYDNQEDFEEITTEIEIFEEIPKAREVEFETTETISETITEELVAESREEFTSESIAEELTDSTEEIESSGNDVVEQSEDIEVAERETTESESDDDTRTADEEVETSDNEVESRETETTDTDASVESNREDTPTTIEDISVEKITAKVEKVIKELDKQLLVTNIIIAKSMQSNVDIDSYGKVNNNLFNNQVIMNGGSYDEPREYVDNRNIYQSSQVIYNDDFSKYKKKIDDAKIERIRAVNNLNRIINGH